MKKNLIVMAVMLITLSVTAQKKKGKGGNNDCYLATAVETFNLSEEKKATLNELLKDRLENRAKIRKQVRASEISKDDVKGEMSKVNQNYFNKVATLTGKSKKEVMVFEKETRKKCSGK